jgi:hypothetical protein
MKHSEKLTLLQTHDTRFTIHNVNTVNYKTNTSVPTVFYIRVIQMTKMDDIVSVNVENDYSGSKSMNVDFSVSKTANIRLYSYSLLNKKIQHTVPLSAITII